MRSGAPSARPWQSAPPAPVRPDAPAMLPRPDAPPNLGSRHLERPARHDPEGLSEKTSLINRDELLARPQGAPGRTPAAGPPPADWVSGWGQSQGGVADFSFVNDIRSSELVPTRKIPP